MSHLIFLDTETTGLDPNKDEIIEIGCVKITDINNLLSEEVFHEYLNPVCDITKEAFNVHGISKEFLKNKPRFSEIVQKLLDFIGDSVLIAHNASFDIKFLNKELSRADLPIISNKVIDSLGVARQMYPGMPNGLDALIKRFSMKVRNLHSALEDARILKNVYAAMCSKGSGEKDELITKVESKEVQTNFTFCTNRIKEGAI
jgi:DNA polymerase-3 subunit epsilon